MESILIIKSRGKEPSPEEMQQMLVNYRPWMQRYVESGNYLGGGPFQPKGVLIESQGKHQDDGIFMNTDQPINGYIHLKTENLEEAQKIADECPLLQCNQIVIRPVMEMEK